MSFIQNYGVKDPCIDDSEETIFTESELLQMKIEEHLAEEEAELERIIETDKEMRS